MSSATVVPDAGDPPWPLYAAAVVELALDGDHLVLTPVPTPEESGDPGEPVADGVDGGVPSPLSPWGPPVWVLTAGDPYPRTLDATTNAERNTTLRGELDALGIRHDPALGRSPDGSVWELSVAVRGVDRERVRAIAARHGQLAVYEVDDRIRCVDVVTGAIVTTRPYRLERRPLGDAPLAGPPGWRD